MYPVPATGYRQSAINNLLAPKPTPKPSSNPNPNPSSSKKTKTDMKLPKCQCTAEQYHLFDICCFWCVMTPLTIRINCGFIHSYLLLISDFRPVVNFNYVSSPNLVLSRKVLLKSAACVSKFQSFWSFPIKQHMRSFYATACTTDCLQMLYILAKTKFPCRI